MFADWPSRRQPERRILRRWVQGKNPHVKPVERPQSVLEAFKANQNGATAQVSQRRRNVLFSFSRQLTLCVEPLSQSISAQCQSL